MIAGFHGSVRVRRSGGSQVVALPKSLNLRTGEILLVRAHQEPGTRLWVIELRPAMKEGATLYEN
jgi:virulence-associated protein VagC